MSGLINLRFGNVRIGIQSAAKFFCQNKGDHLCTYFVAILTNINLIISKTIIINTNGPFNNKIQFCDKSSEKN